MKQLQAAAAAGERRKEPELRVSVLPSSVDERRAARDRIAKGMVFRLRRRREEERNQGRNRGEKMEARKNRESIGVGEPVVVDVSASFPFPRVPSTVVLSSFSRETFEPATQSIPLPSLAAAAAAAVAVDPPSTSQ